MPLRLIIEEESDVEIELQELNGVVSTDQLEGNGNVTLDGTLSVSESGVLPDGDYPIITTTGTLSDTFANLQLPMFCSIIYTTNEVILRKETPLNR